jgi:hypothetical protein
VFENAAWGPGRARLAAEREDPDTIRAIDLADAAPALRDEASPLKFRGRVEQGDTVFFSQAASDGWRLTAGGRAATRRRGLGFANAFTVSRGGRATLTYKSSPGRPLLVLLELGLWVGAIRYVVVSRRRRRAVA